jgi:hypothetical protein
MIRDSRRNNTFRLFAQLPRAQIDCGVESLALEIYICNRNMGNHDPYFSERRPQGEYLNLVSIRLPSLESP